MFNGIPISEYGLLAHSVIFTILLLGLAVAFGFWLYVSLIMKNRKKRQHLRKLKEKAKGDDLAKKQLERIERKKKRRRKRENDNIITDILIWSMTICLAIVILAWGVIPGWTDYVKKDYVVYKGEITVYQQAKRSRIELEDGTIIWGRGDFDEEDTHGTVVYSKRTKLFLGGSN